MRNRIFTDDELRKCVSDGKTLREIAKEFGCAYGTVASHVSKLGLHTRYDMSLRNASQKHIERVIETERTKARALEKKRISAMIIQMRADGCLYPSIADATGKSIDYISCFCQRYGCAYTVEETQKAAGQYRDDNIVRQNIKNLNRSVSYLSGYRDKNSLLELQHNACGHVLHMTYHGLCCAPNKPVICPVCREQRKAQKKADAEKKSKILVHCASCGKEFQPKRTTNRFCSSDCAYQWHLDQQHIDKVSQFVSEIKTCAYCGKRFETRFKWRSDYCTKRCQRRATKCSTVYARIKSKSQIVDTDITLPKLYERDGGVCYLCGTVCDWNDKRITDSGYWSFGDSYPSIDHVIPLAKNGTHAWSNIRLACRRCNSNKRDNILEGTTAWQFAM